VGVLKYVLQTFMVRESTKVTLEKAGERALPVKYGSQVHDRKTARLQKFQTKVTMLSSWMRTTREASADIRRHPIS